MFGPPWPMCVTPTCRRRWICWPAVRCRTSWLTESLVSARWSTRSTVLRPALRAGRSSWTPNVADVAILGTGRMGSAMAHRVAAAGHELTLWNRTEATARTLAESIAAATVRVASTPQDAVSDKAIILCVLADADAGRAVLMDPAVLAQLTPGAVVCDLGTSGVIAAHDFEAGLHNAGARFVDAPVSGSVPAVQTGTLLVMAGGDAADVDAAATVVGAFAGR